MKATEEKDRNLRKSRRTLKELALEYPEGGYEIKIEEIQEQLDTIQQEAHSKVPLPKRLQRSNQKITKLEAKTAKLAEQAKSLALTIEQNQQWLKEVEESIKATDEALKEQNKENSEIAHLMAEAGDEEEEDEDEDEFMGPPKRRSNVNTPRDQQAPQNAKLLMSQIDPDGQLYKDLESFCRAGDRPKGKTNQKEQAPSIPTGHQEGKGKAKGQVPKPDEPHKNTEDTPNKGEGHSSDSKEDGDRSRSPPAGRAGAKGSSSGGTNKKSGTVTTYTTYA